MSSSSTPAPSIGFANLRRPPASSVFNSGNVDWVRQSSTASGELRLQLRRCRMSSSSTPASFRRLRWSLAASMVFGGARRPSSGAPGDDNNCWSCRCSGGLFEQPSSSSSRLVASDCRREERSAGEIVKTRGGKQELHLAPPWFTPCTAFQKLSAKALFLMTANFPLSRFCPSLYFASSAR
jgi:hypothetical protein